MVVGEGPEESGVEGVEGTVEQGFCSFSRADATDGGGNNVGGEEGDGTMGFGIWTDIDGNSGD